MDKDELIELRAEVKEIRKNLRAKVQEMESAIVIHEGKKTDLHEAIDWGDAEYTIRGRDLSNLLGSQSRDLECWLKPNRDIHYFDEDGKIGEHPAIKKIP